jgi:hypothetical protein
MGKTHKPYPEEFRWQAAGRFEDKVRRPHRVDSAKVAQQSAAPAGLNRTKPQAGAAHPIVRSRE